MTKKKKRIVKKSKKPAASGKRDSFRRTIVSAPVHPMGEAEPSFEREKEAEDAPVE